MRIAGLVITLPGVPVSGGYRMVVRPASVLRELDRLRPDSVEGVGRGDHGRRGRVVQSTWRGCVLFSHERLDLWLAARLPGLWRHVGDVLAPAVGRWNRRLAARFDVVVVTSAFARDEFARLGVKTLRRVPLGVDLTTFRPTASLPDNEAARLVYAGRLSPEENPGAVIEAVKLLVRNGTTVNLDIYGTGSALPALRRAATGLPVTFHGHVSGRARLATALASADVAFAPSAAETFGLSVLEALACGTPVVAANTGGARELLAPGAAVAVAATPAGIAQGVLEVISWPVADRRAAARRQAERFPWSATVEQMLDLHATVGAAAAGKTR